MCVVGGRKDGGGVESRSPLPQLLEESEFRNVKRRRSKYPTVFMCEKV